MELNKAIKSRHSVRRFTTRKPDYRKIIEALDYAKLVPLAGNISTIKFILIQDKEKIKQLAKASQQDFIATTHYVVAVCSDNKLAKKSYDERAERYCRQQAGAAIQNLLLKLTELGLASCWIGYFVDDQVENILQTPEDVKVEALLPIGYELGKGKQRIKQDLDRCLFFDVWKNKFMRKKPTPEAL